VAVRGTTLAQVWQARSPKDSDPARAVPARLRELGQRTLVIWGAADPVFPVADAHRLLGMLPNATLRVIEGSGHLPHEEYEPATTAAILEFLRATTDD
jgi:pimeloyl-ACP methyl ester carboxylesterase